MIFFSERRIWLKSLIWIALCSSFLSCKDDNPEPGSSQSDKPLRPLIYTQLPEATPQAVAVRERRLMRILAENETAQKNAAFDTHTRYQPIRDPETLGQTLFKALMTRDEFLWESVFVKPKDFATLVKIEEKKAQRDINQWIAGAHRVWQLFEIKKTSEAPAKGLATIFEFKSLNLGQGRLLNGKLAKPSQENEISQHWGNTLILGLRNTDVVFEIHIPKILRLSEPSASETVDTPQIFSLTLASKMKADGLLHIFIETGMHLKPELLRHQEYPYPLAVGNFWRYRRTEEESTDPVQMPTKSLSEDPPSLLSADIVDDLPPDIFLEGFEDPTEGHANEVMVEVLKIEPQYRARLIKMRYSFNDTHLKKYIRYWFVTPRCIYLCNRDCLRHKNDMDWLLKYMQQRAPIFRFPLKNSLYWHQYKTSDLKKARFSVRKSSEDIEVPAGRFIASLTIDGVIRHSGAAPFLSYITQETRWFIPGKGMVYRQFRGKDPAGKPLTVTHSLLEYRIIP